MNQKLNTLLLGFAVASLTACGGGGGGDDVKKDPVLSTTQQNFEASAVKDSWVRFSWNMPTTNVLPTTGTHYFYVENFSLPSSPSLGTVDLTQSQINMASSLALPDMNQQGVSRVVKNGAIYVSNQLSRNSFRYVDNDVIEDQFASDGVTRISQIRYDNWSAPITLTGVISNASILKHFLSFTKSTSTLFYDFSKSWQSGSSYVTRKSYFVGDTLYARDWIGAATTYTNAVAPYPGTETTIETLFNNPSLVSAGGLVVNNITYPLAGGTIVTMEGVRAWVANAARPASVSPTDDYVAIFELNGHLYFGTVIRDGTRIRVLDGVDSTIINDYSIRLNMMANDSIKQTIKF